MVEFRDVDLRKVYKGTYLGEGRLAGNECNVLGERNDWNWFYRIMCEVK